MGGGLVGGRLCTGGLGGGGLGGGGLVGEDVGVGGVVGAGIASGGFDGVGVEDDDLGDAGGCVAVLDDDAVVALVSEFLGADGAGVCGGAGGESGVGGGLVGGALECDEDGIGVLAVSGGVDLVGGEVGALDVHGCAAAGGVEDADAGGGGVVPEDAGFAVLVEELGVDGLGVVFPVAEEAFEVGGADVHPELLGELGALAVGGLEPGVAALMEVPDGVALGLRGVGELGVFDAGRPHRRFRRCRRFRNALAGDGRGLGIGGGGVGCEGLEHTALGVLEGEGGTLGEEGLDGFDDGRVLLVGAGIFLGEGEDVLAVLEAIVDLGVLVDGLPDTIGQCIFVVRLDEVLDVRREPVGDGECDAGRELGLDGVEELGGFCGGFAGEAGDGGGAVGNLDRHAFAHGEAAVVGVDGLEAVVGAVTGAAHEVGDVGADTVGDVLCGAGGFGESAVAVRIEESRVLVAALLGVVDDALDRCQREGVVVWSFVWYSNGVQGMKPTGRPFASFGFVGGDFRSGFSPEHV